MSPGSRWHRLLIHQLKYYSGALLIISHDRYFLDQVVDKIWELNEGKITEYWGGYSDYLRQKEEERHSQVAKYKQFTAERERLEKAITEKHNQARKVDQKAKGASRKTAPIAAAAWLIKNQRQETKSSIMPLNIWSTESKHSVM